jgi:hypothetical protein
VRKNSNSRGARRGFSIYPCRCLSGAISTAQNCAKAATWHYVQENLTSTTNTSPECMFCGALNRAAR